MVQLAPPVHRRYVASMTRTVLGRRYMVLVRAIHVDWLLASMLLSVVR